MRRRIGIVAIIVALAMNRWVIGFFASPDGRIESPLWNAVIVLFELLLLAVGLLLLFLRRSNAPSASSWALVAGAILSSVAMVECGARMFDELAPSPRIYPGERESRPGEHFVSDPELGWRMRPNHRFSWTIDGVLSTYVSDADGFRTHDGEPKGIEAGARRIVLIGDSFTFGTGVDYAETFGARLETSSAAVRNLAMPGYGIDQMWLMLDRRALDLDPDLVIVGFIDEDFDRSLTAHRPNEGFDKPAFLLEGDALRPLRAEDRPGPLVRLVEERSWLFSAGRSLVRSAAYQIPMGEWWSLNRALFGAMIDRCRRANVPLLFVRLPQRPPKPFLSLAREMSALGADYLDLSSEPAEEPIHFPVDGHIDARGHRWVAAKLSEAIDRQTSSAASSDMRGRALGSSANPRSTRSDETPHAANTRAKP